MAKRNDYHRDGPSAEERALERFTELMIEKISTLQKDWSKPWFTEGMMKWPKNLSGREYNIVSGVHHHLYRGGQGNERENQV